MMTHRLHVAGNLPLKTVVARQLPASKNPQTQYTYHSARNDYGYKTTEAEKGNFPHVHNAGAQFAETPSRKLRMLVSSIHTKRSYSRKMRARNLRRRHHAFYKS